MYYKPYVNFQRYCCHAEVSSNTDNHIMFFVNYISHIICILSLKKPL